MAAWLLSSGVTMSVERCRFATWCCETYCNGCMNVAWALFWGGSRSTKPCIFSCKVVAAGDEVRSVKCGLWSVKCGVLRAQCEVKCGVRREQCEVWSVKCEVWSVKIAVRSVKCEVELQMWHVKQDTTFAECTHARAWLAHGACKFYRWERSYSISVRQLLPRLVRVLLVL